MLGGGRPSRTGPRSRRVAPHRREADGQPGDGRLTRAARGGAEPGAPPPAGRTAAPGRSRRARRAAPMTRSRSERRHSGGPGDRGRRRRGALALVAASQHGGREARRVVVVGVRPGRRRRRGRGAAGSGMPPAASGAGRLGRASRAGPGASNRLLARTTSTMPGRRVRDERLDVAGEVEARSSRPPGSRRCRRRAAERGAASDGVADRRASAGSAGGSCTGCPGRAR